MRGGGKLAVRVRRATLWHTGKPGIRITIADSGHGMSPETRAMLFSPLFTTKGIEGTGRGLWISKDIVEKHGGLLIHCSTQQPPRPGTSFSVLLPLQAEFSQHPQPEVPSPRNPASNRMP
jgi:signal transduction histidine kinase